MRQKDRKIVLGLGNLLLGDEGFGIHAIHFVRRRLAMYFPSEWVDGGVLGLGLLPLVEECSHLLVLDAVDGGQPAGTISEMAMDVLPAYNAMKLSEHQVGFQEVLALARLRDNFPTHLHLVGVQPASMNPGVELSPVVSATLPAVTQRATHILQHWF